MTSILLRKSVVDVMRRKGRAVLMILGIFIGVLGLSLVTFASDLFSQNFRDYITPVNQPEIVFQLNQTPVAVLTQVQSTPNVAQMQIRSQFLTHWHTSMPNSPLMAVYSYPNVYHMRLASYQLISGHMPGRGEVVLAGRDQFIQHVQLGGTITLDNQYGQPVPLHVSGFARTEETSSSTSLVGLAYISPEEQTHLVPDPEAALSAFAQGTGLGLSRQLMIQTHKTDASSL